MKAKFKGNGNTPAQRRAAEAIETNLIAEVNLSNVLAARAETNKFYLSTCEELARTLHISIDAIYKLRDAGAPMICGKARPEWFLEFARTAGSVLPKFRG